MSNGSILSFLAQKHITQREVVATDGLVFLLSRSHAALTGVARLVGVERDDIRVEGQLVDGESKPDVALLEPTTRKPLALLELKFWAALTHAQPAKYLQMLDEEGGGSLCFVAPPSRHPALWQELLQRAKGFSASTGSKLVATRGSTTLRLISWEQLLAPVAVALEGTTMLTDLNQLRGLVQDFESAGFRPFQSEDVSNLEEPRLAIALAELAEAVTEQALADGTLTDSRQAHGWRHAGMSITLAEGPRIWFGLAHVYWARYGLTPLWIEVTAEDEPTEFQRVRRSLATSFGGPCPMAFEPEKGVIAFAVPLPLQVERAVAVRSGAQWLKDFQQQLINSVP